MQLSSYMYIKYFDLSLDRNNPWFAQYITCHHNYGCYDSRNMLNKHFLLSYFIFSPYCYCKHSVRVG